MKGSRVAGALRQKSPSLHRSSAWATRIEASHHHKLVSLTGTTTSAYPKHQSLFHPNSASYARKCSATVSRSEPGFTVSTTAATTSSANPRRGPSTIYKFNGSDSTAHNPQINPVTPHSCPVILESSVNSWSLLVICGLIGAFLYLGYPVKFKEIPGQNADAEHHQIGELESQDLTTSDNMSAEVLPGRPGTLTPEEEEKLKEFWMAVAQVAGFSDGVEAPEGPEAPNRTDTAASAKDKKKKKGLFRRKKNDDTPAPVDSAEDKYGQTKEFHDALANMTPEAIRDAIWGMVKHDNPDALLLRFLRARKWDVEKALVMMVSTMRWRVLEMHVDDDVMKLGEEGALIDETSTDPAKKALATGFLHQMRIGKSFLHGLDIEGRPMCFVRARLHRQAEQNEESLERYTVYLIESARLILNPPADTACLFFDLTGFSLANMDYTPIKFMIKCFEANYPESLGTVLVHKAPWVFQGIWKIIKGLLDPVVAAKVVFTNNAKDLETYIDKSHIFKELEGEEDWAYEYVEPVIGENELMKDTVTRDKLLEERALIFKEYEKTTMQWVQGTGAQDEVKAKRNELALKVKDSYWQLDPYVRAKSVYDRIGMLGPGGQTAFYPTANGSAPPVATTADDVD